MYLLGQSVFFLNDSKDKNIHKKGKVFRSGDQFLDLKTEKSTSIEIYESNFIRLKAKKELFHNFHIFFSEIKHYMKDVKWQSEHRGIDLTSPVPFNIKLLSLTSDFRFSLV